LSVSNTRLPEHLSPVGKLRLAADTVWSPAGARAVAAAAEQFQPDVVHFHNTFPLISPAAYQAAREHGAAVVQSLHNYRLICPAATCFRDGHICTECVGHALPIPSVVHGCYRASRVQTLPVAGLVGVHNLRGTWRTAVDRYIALSGAQRDLLVAGGLPAERIDVKPNAADGICAGVPVHERPPGVLFVGRLTAEKGVHTLLAAWRDHMRGVPLRIIGTGPLEQLVSAAAAANCDMEWLGFQPRERTLQEMRSARLVLVPSTWIEPFGLTVVEAFGSGTPVVAGDLGGPAEIVDDSMTGWLTSADDPAALARTVTDALAQPEQLTRMGHAAREAYVTRYTTAAGYSRLIEIYDAAMATALG
jgi:glycosyltransferase involved in cell wall biosynthesis